jgi:hypothetical protein
MTVSSLRRILGNTMMLFLNNNSASGVKIFNDFYQLLTAERFFQSIVCSKSIGQNKVVFRAYSISKSIMNP